MANNQLTTVVALFSIWAGFAILLLSGALWLVDAKVDELGKSQRPAVYQEQSIIVVPWGQIMPRAKSQAVLAEIRERIKSGATPRTAKTHRDAIVRQISDEFANRRAELANARARYFQKRGQDDPRLIREAPPGSAGHLPVEAAPADDITREGATGGGDSAAGGAADNGGESEVEA